MARLVTCRIHGTFPLKCVTPFLPSVPWGNNLDSVCIVPLILPSALCAARFLPYFVFTSICHCSACRLHCGGQVLVHVEKSWWSRAQQGCCG